MNDFARCSRTLTFRFSSLPVTDIEFSIALVDQEQSFFYLTSIELNSMSD